MKKTPINLALDFGDLPVAKPRDPEGQAGQVLSLIRDEGPFLSLRGTADFAIPEFAARVHDLRAAGWNIVTMIIRRVTFRGVERRNVAAYSLGSPEWVPPCGRAS